MTYHYLASATAGRLAQTLDGIVNEHSGTIVSVNYIEHLEAYNVVWSSEEDVLAAVPPRHPVKVTPQNLNI
jgi:hypothetical protein